MNLHKCLLTANDCYRAGRTITPKGVMVHSTGANNPKVSRYVQGDSVVGLNTAGNHWDRPGIDRCVHAFVGRFADCSVGTAQALPWTMRGWHCGKGSKGSGNDTNISFEICEDGLTDASYFQAVYQEAVELTAYLCREFHFDPLADGVVICHAEGHQRGIASNHADVLHWFQKFGKSMDDFRADVAQTMEGDDSVTYEQWLEYMTRYRQELAKQEATMPDLLADAKAMGLTDGTRPRDLVTREDASIMARAAAKQ